MWLNVLVENYFLMYTRFKSYINRNFLIYLVITYCLMIFVNKFALEGLGDF